MYRNVLAVLVLVSGFLASGCTSIAPLYGPSMENVQALKDAGDVKAKVGAFSAKENLETARSISMRASKVVSPYGESYAAYLEEAVKQEMSLAGKLSPNASSEVSGVLLKNSIDIGGFSVGYGDIQVRFVVKKNGSVQYDQVKSAHREWESAFAGAVAIPRGKIEYSNLVQMLLKTLYADQNFVQALK
jgi:hypothetical protein